MLSGDDDAMGDAGSALQRSLKKCISAGVDCESMLCRVECSGVVFGRGDRTPFIGCDELVFDAGLFLR